MILRKAGTMTILGDVFGRADGPYKNKSINLTYSLLFCDNVELYINSDQNPEIYPWNIVLSKKAGITDLEKITKDNNLESRAKILAYHELKTRRVTINKKELLGIIIEIGLDKGLDVLAVYKDGTARYISQSGKLTIWNTRDDKSDAIIRELLSHGENVINNIEPWDEPRLAHPEKGMARLTFLVPGGLYIGQGPIGVLLEDKMGKPVLQSGAKLVHYFIEKDST
jgi:hypothetical protein